jgi:hypothetical protein
LLDYSVTHNTQSLSGAIALSNPGAVELTSDSLGYLYISVGVRVCGRTHTLRHISSGTLLAMSTVPMNTFQTRDVRKRYEEQMEQQRQLLKQKSGECVCARPGLLSIQ